MFNLNERAILGSHLDSTNKVPVVASSSLMSGTSSGGSSGFNAGGTFIQHDLSYHLLDGFVNYRSQNTLYKMYREIYTMDAITGPAIDQISSLPWSSYSLLGIQDKQIMDIYTTSLSELNIIRLLTYMSTTYLVLGTVIGSLIFDKDRGIFSDCILYNPDDCELIPIPMIGYDPKVNVKISKEMITFLNSTDFRDLEAKKEISSELEAQLRSGKAVMLEPLSTLVLCRNMIPGVTNLSYLSRILPIWIVEKALTRGTIQAALERQRGVLHIQCEDYNTLVDVNGKLEKIGSIIDPLDKIDIGSNLKLKGKTTASNNRQRIKLSSISYQGKQTLISVRTESGFSVNLPSNQKILVKSEDNVTLKSVANLQIGDEVVANNKNYTTDNKLYFNIYYGKWKKPPLPFTTPEYMTPELAYLMGMIISDGTVRKYSVYISNNNLNVLNKCREYIKKIFGLKPRIKVSTEKGHRNKIGSRTIQTRHTIYNIELNNIGVIEFLSQIGILKNSDINPDNIMTKISSKKRIPWSIFAADIESKYAFLAGYIDGDGNIGQDYLTAGLRILSHSKRILKDFRRLLCHMGIFSKTQKTVQRITVLGQENSFYWKIKKYLNHSQKKKVVVPTRDKELGDCIFEPITALVKSPFSIDCYNIETIENKPFFANGLFASNIVAGNTLIDIDGALYRIDNYFNKNYYFAPSTAFDVNFTTVGEDGKRVKVKKWIYQGEKPTYRLMTKSGYSIKTTDNHKFVVLGRERLELQYRELKDIKVGDYVVITDIHQVRKNYLYKEDLKNDGTEPSVFQKLVGIPTECILAELGQRLIKHERPYSWFYDDKGRKTSVFGFLDKTPLLCGTAKNKYLTYFGYPRGTYDLMLEKINEFSPDLKNRIEFFLQKQYLFDPVISIEEKDTNKVYDLSIDTSSGDKPLFASNGILVHNCIHSDTQLYVNGQLKPIGRIVSNVDHKSNVQQVFDVDFYTRGLDDKAVRVYKLIYQGKRRIFQLVTFNGLKIKCTQDHKFACLDDKNQVYYRELLQLTDSDRIITIKGLSCPSYVRDLEYIDDVYDISIDTSKGDEPAFFANGLLAHNCGDDSFEYTEQQMQSLVSLVQNTSRDPQGAVIATRPDVNISEFRQGSDFWSINSERDIFTNVKLRALGLSESFGADTNYSSGENSITIFLEHMRSFRENFTRAVLYDKVFLLLAKYHGFRKRTTAEINHNIRYDSSSSKAAKDARLTKYAEVTGSRNLAEAANFYIPEIRWTKELQARGDSNALSLLQTAKDLGMPLPLGLVSTAAGIPLSNLLDNLNEDIEARKKIKAYQDEIKKINPDAGGGEGDDSSMFGSVVDNDNNQSYNSLNSTNSTSGENKTVGQTPINRALLAKLRHTGLNSPRQLAKIKNKATLMAYLEENIPPDVTVTPQQARQILRQANSIKPGFVKF